MSAASTAPPSRQASAEEVAKYRRFMPIAFAYAELSKDPHTKAGALVLGPGFETRSQGYNGAPRGSRADDDERFERPEKYWWVAHAEANAIANAARAGTALEGCTLVVTMPVCMDCAKLVVQAGIRRVVHGRGLDEFRERWADSLQRSRRLFSECGVDVIEVG